MAADIVTGRAKVRVVAQGVRVVKVHYLFIPMFLLASGTALASTEVLVPDHPTDIAGVQAVCTGGSENARENPAWRDYRMRLEFVGKHGQYLGDETVNVSGNGMNFSVQCAGPWVLMNLPKGTYKVSTDVANAGHKNMTVHSPGQAIVRFPRAGSEAG